MHLPSESVLTCATECGRRGGIHGAALQTMKTKQELNCATPAKQPTKPAETILSHVIHWFLPATVQISHTQVIVHGTLPDMLGNTLHGLVNT
jgi:hypothetical protein